jgi:hypothetical protein
MSTFGKRFESIDRPDNESVWPNGISRPTDDICILKLEDTSSSSRLLRAVMAIWHCNNTPSMEDVVIV